MNLYFSLALAAAIGAGAAYVHHEGEVAGDAAGYKRGHAEAVDVKQSWDADRLRMTQAAAAEQAKHDQEHATIVAQQEKADHVAHQALLQRDAALADARTAHRSLLDAARALAAANPGGGQADVHSAAVGSDGSPERPFDLLVDVFGWSDEATGEVALYADGLAISLSACQREYDSVRTQINGQ